MATVKKEKPLVVIVGPTASGKSSVAMEVARKHGGEIICADSRTIYKGMDIGTAKPSLGDQQEIPHFGLDLVEPGEVFTAADFQRYAKQKIGEIRARGNVPILVGGTGLYIDAVMFDYEFGQKTSTKNRQFLYSMSLEELHNYSEEHNIPLPKNIYNKRYVIRAIEQGGVNNKRLLEPTSNTVVVGITTDKKVLRTRIQNRAQALFRGGMIEEARQLAREYGWESEAMTGNIYRLVRQYDEGKLNKDQLFEKFVIADWRLAKRQLTWLKRNRFINWVPLERAYTYISQRLAD
ncbi:MAG TPA: tRNA (adenosine(37)-N6)-dimethylallyltransferase MiaA [Candidatus Saccharibacteria bacterium]|nr:tRNA (adenosine(37)-N6)-dimethylallyltransferase MiaA [Candidatus Saccharibacteria bacterium]